MSAKDFFQKVYKAKLKKALSSDDPNELKAVAQDVGYGFSFEQLDYVARGVSFDYNATACD